MNMVMTTIISIFSIRPNFCNATFEKLLSSFPIGYKFILPGVDIMDIDELEARKLIRKRIQEFPFPMFRQKLSKCMCTPNVLNSFVFRLDNCNNVVSVARLVVSGLHVYTLCATVSIESPHNKGESLLNRQIAILFPLNLQPVQMMFAWKFLVVHF